MEVMSLPSMEILDCPSMPGPNLIDITSASTDADVQRATESAYVDLMSEFKEKFGDIVRDLTIALSPERERH